MIKQIFINLPVTDLHESIEFFTKLGFTFNPQFTGENATCLIIGENIFAMLLVEKFFKEFLPDREIADTSKSAEAIVALATNNRDDVDRMLDKVLAAGGKEYREAMDYGWMYGRVFLDLDGHIWEVFHIDESSMPEEMKNKG